MAGDLYIGIDPGKGGGAGVVNSLGDYVFSWRWQEKRVRDAFQELERFRPHVRACYLEHIRFFTQRSKGQILGGQELMRNSGMWEGWLIALEIPYALIEPATWMSQLGLSKWRQRAQELAQAFPEANLLEISPLALARRSWPEAPLQYLACDGMAVGLLLAELARKHVIYDVFGKTEPVRRPSRRRKRTMKGLGQAIFKEETT